MTYSIAALSAFLERNDLGRITNGWDCMMLGKELNRSNMFVY